jgi:hypothetical protein
MKIGEEIFGKLRHIEKPPYGLVVEIGNNTVMLPIELIELEMSLESMAGQNISLFRLDSQEYYSTESWP